MTIGNRLQILRTAKGMSQPQLARAAGVSQQLISQIEKGRNISSKALPALASALGCSIWDIDPRFIDVVEPPKTTRVPIYEFEDIAGIEEYPKTDNVIALGGLEKGDWFATYAPNDAMDLVAPEGSLLIINRAETNLEDDGVYIFEVKGGFLLRRYRAGNPPRLLPHSINPEFFALPLEAGMKVIGRCRRSRRYL